MYMAPELHAGGVATPASDVFSLGVLLVLVATGAFPEAGVGSNDFGSHAVFDVRAQLEARAPDLPLGLRQAIAQALDADPTRRPPNGARFSALL
jgi:serine/threonine protein kinase